MDAIESEKARFDARLCHHAGGARSVWQELSRRLGRIFRRGQPAGGTEWDEAPWDVAFDAWQKAVSELVSPPATIAAETLEHIWQKFITVREKALKKVEVKNAPIWHHSLTTDACSALFDFRPGPPRFRANEKDFREGQEYPSTNERRPPGLQVDQNVFLTPPPGLGEGEMDDFAERVVYGEGDAEDGVACLAGVRGSGKSTLLNRIEWFSRNWVLGSQRPMLIRFDLGCAFENRKFTMDFLAAICREAQSHCRRAPLAPRWSPNFLRTWVGQVGQWCETNLRWAFLVLVVGVVFLAFDALQPLNDAWDGSLLVPHATRAIATLLVGTVILLGACHLVARHLAAAFPAFLKQPNPWWIAMCLLFLPLLIFVVAALRGWSAFQTPWSVKEVLIAWGVVLSTLALSMAFLPTFWWTYLHCQHLQTALRSRDGVASPDLPYLPQVTALARMLLPQPGGLAEVRELDAPFLQEQMKMLLARCTAEFGRVIILIDDVDMLPNKSFHELFRILRPVTKVSGVRCLVCAPQYLFEAMNPKRLGDVHSTVRRSYLLGDRRLYERTPAGVKLRDIDRREFSDAVRRLLESRLKVRVRGQLRKAGVFDPVLRPWEDDLHWPTVRDVLEKLGPTRRELLREIEAALRTPGLKPFAALHEELDEAVSRRFELSKTDYYVNEVVLECDVDQRRKIVEAIAALHDGGPPPGGGGGPGGPRRNRSNGGPRS